MAAKNERTETYTFLSQKIIGVWLSPLMLHFMSQNLVLFYVLKIYSAENLVTLGLLFLPPNCGHFLVFLKIVQDIFWVVIVYFGVLFLKMPS